MIFQTVYSCLRGACTHEDGGMTDESFGFYLILIPKDTYLYFEVCQKTYPKICSNLQNLQKTFLTKSRLTPQTIHPQIDPRRTEPNPQSFRPCR